MTKLKRTAHRRKRQAPADRFLTELKIFLGDSESWKSAFRLATCITFWLVVFLTSHGFAFYYGARAMFFHMMGP